MDACSSMPWTSMMHVTSISTSKAPQKTCTFVSCYDFVGVQYIYSSSFDILIVWCSHRQQNSIVIFKFPASRASGT